MAADEPAKVLRHARAHLVDIQRHLDDSADGEDLTEVGRAWARTLELERLLRSLLPPDATTVATTVAR
jgi:hypothetical protein